MCMCRIPCELPTARALTKKPVSGFQHMVCLNILGVLSWEAKHIFETGDPLGLEVIFLMDLVLSLGVPRDFLSDDSAMGSILELIMFFMKKEAQDSSC